MIALIFHNSGIAQAMLFCCLLLAVSLWDLYKRIVPNTLSLLILGVGLLDFTPDKLFGILLGLPLLVGALLADYWGKGSIGGGDIKLTAACGFVLNIPVGTTGLCLGLIAFCLGYCVLIVFYKYKHLSPPPAELTAMPMAPFLSLGFIVAYFFNLGGLIT